MQLLGLLQLQKSKQAVGTLVLGKTNSFRELFFEKDRVYLCEDSYSGKVDMPSLNDSGLLGTSLSAERLEATLHSDDLRSSMLPQVLSDQGLLDDAECLRRLAESHIREEILQLFLRCRESFSFQEGRVPERLFAADGLACRTPVTLDRLIEDFGVRLRERERLRLILPSREEVFVLTAEGMQFKQNGASDYPVQRLLATIDGFRDLRQLLEAAPFFEHYTQSLLVESLERGLVKKTVLPELRNVSTSELTPETCRRYLPYFKNAVKYSVDPLSARERLAVLHEKLGEADLAVVQYNFVGDALYRMGKPSLAIKAYHKARTLKPDERLITDKITRIYTVAAETSVREGKHDEAVQLLENALRICPDDADLFERVVDICVVGGRFRELEALCEKLSAAAEQSGDKKRAVDIWSTVVDRTPEHSGFKKRLINACLDAGEVRTAVRHLRALAHRHLSRNEPDRALEVIEKLLRLGADTDDLKRLRESLRAKLGLEGKRPLLLRRRVALPTVLVIVLLSYQLWSYLSWRTIESERVALAAAATESRPQPDTEALLADHDALLAEMRPGQEEVRFRSLVARCDAFVRLFPISLFSKEAADLSRRAQERVEALAADRDRIKAEVLRSARQYLLEGDRPLVEKTLAPILELDEDDSWREEAVLMLERVQGVRLSSSAIFREAQKLEQEGKPRAAFQMYVRLLRDFPNSQYARDLTLPILVESLPAGGYVVDLDRFGSGNGVLGETPFVTRLAPGEELSIEITRPGYYPLRTRLTQADGAYNQFLLFREPARTRALAKPLVLGPVASGDGLVLPLRDGTLQIEPLSSDRPSGSHTRNAVHALKGPPLAFGDDAFVLWDDGTASRLPLSSGREQVKPAAQRYLPGDDLGVPSTGLAHVGNRSLVLGTARDNLLLVRPRDLFVTSQLALGYRPRTVDAHSNGVVVVAGDGGKLTGVSALEERVLWHVDLGVEISGAPIVLNEAVVVRTGESKLRVLDPRDGSARFAPVPLAKGHRVVVDRQLELIHAWSGDGRLATFAPSSGEVLRHRQLELDATMLDAAHGRIAIVHRSGHGLLVLDARTLEPSWATETTSPITSLASTDERMALALEDGRLLILSNAPAETGETVSAGRP